MKNLKSTSVKNLDKNPSTRRVYDIRVVEHTGNINAAILHGQLLHHYKNLGPFSKTDKELSKESNLYLKTLQRMKRVLIEERFISIHMGCQNKTVYLFVKELEDFRNLNKIEYNINYCIINDDTNSGILLSQLVNLSDHYCKEEGNSEFFQTNESLMKNLFLTKDEIQRAKKKLLMNGFITTRIGLYGRTYYMLNMDKIEEAINRSNVVCP